MVRRWLAAPILAIVAIGAIVLIVGSIFVLRLWPAPGNPGAGTTSSVPSALLTSQWKLVAMTYAGQPRTLLSSAPITLTFESGQDGQRFGGSSGCNAYGGKFTTTAGHLSFSEIATTAMACLTSGVMEQEHYYTTALEHTSLFSIDASGDLTLRDDAGSYVLRYTPSPLPPTPPVGSGTSAPANTSNAP